MPYAFGDVFPAGYAVYLFAPPGTADPAGQ
jgi:hypothetical protein